MKRIKAALPCFIACVCAPAHADPMRPLTPPPNPASAAAASTGSNPSGERAARPNAADTGRELERLVAIRQDSVKRWQALVGERWLSVGDRYDIYTVAAIDANAVQLADGRQRRTLHLLPPLWLTGASSPAATDVAQAGAAVPSPYRANRLPTP